jgi:hypothetical protein
VQEPPTAQAPERLPGLPTTAAQCAELRQAATVFGLADPAEGVFYAWEAEGRETFCDTVCQALLRDVGVAFVDVPGRSSMSLFR